MLHDDHKTGFYYAIDTSSPAMSLFERKNEEELRRRNLDESVQISAVITNAVTVDSHTVSAFLNLLVAIRRNCFKILTVNASMCALLKKSAFNSRTVVQNTQIKSLCDNHLL